MEGNSSVAAPSNVPAPEPTATTSKGALEQQQDTSASETSSKPFRTLSDEIYELESVINKFKAQVDAPNGTVGLQPFGSINVGQAQATFVQACARLRKALVTHRDTTLATWGALLANAVSIGTSGNPENAEVVSTTNKIPAAATELCKMRHVTDTLHIDIESCKSMLLDSAADALSRALSYKKHGQSAFLIARIKAIATKLKLAFYTDEQDHDGCMITTVTLAGEILVIDVDICDDTSRLKVKISYVSEAEHDERMNTLLTNKLKQGDIRGFESLIEEVATLDKLTKERSPVNFVHNTFAISSTLKQIQSEELSQLNDNVRELLRSGSGIALPHTRHIGPLTLFHIPAPLLAGLPEEYWDKLKENTVDDTSALDSCGWLYYTWEPTSHPQCFLSALFQQYCLQPDYMIEESGDFRVESVKHPAIQGLTLRFLEFIQPKQKPTVEAADSNAMNVDNQEPPAKNDSFSEQFWIPYGITMKLEPPLYACAWTLRKLISITLSKPEPPSNISEPSGSPNSQDKELGTSQMHDSPRLLEDAPTLEQLIYQDNTRVSESTDASFADTNAIPPVLHHLGEEQIYVSTEKPQIRAWSVKRIPLNRMRNILDVVPILRRQAVFNELFSSSFKSPGSKAMIGCDESSIKANITISVRTLANDPFRIDVLVCLRTGYHHSSDHGNNADVGKSQGSGQENKETQGIILRVVQGTGDIQGWLHQSLSINSTEGDLFTAMGNVTSDSLDKIPSDQALSKVSTLTRSIPMIALWCKNKYKKQEASLATLAES